MSPLVMGLALFAALLHATWNALLRSGADRLWVITIMSFATTAVAIPLAFIFPIPSYESWPFLIISSFLQVGYSVFLTFAYRHGDLGQVYPVIRGSVPLLVTLGGFLLIDQRLDVRSLAGVVLIALGILCLSLGKRRASTKSLLFALATSLLIASYTTTDAIGVRSAGNPRGYATWIFLIYGGLMPLVFVALRGTLKVDFQSAATLKALAGGVVSLIAYGAVISAVALGPVGPISALRETSVVFAALIGRTFLGEALPINRIVGCFTVVLGVCYISIQ